MTQQDYDFAVIGSGFGGSVSALRLSEKGYSVAVIERGKRFAPEDFPKTNWNVRKFLWAPKLFCYGIQALTPLRDVFILHGSGVGGGSLVYANTLLVPPKKIFEQPEWRRMEDFGTELEPHYLTAKKMLGVTPAKGHGEGDTLLRLVAEDMGQGETYASTDVGIFFGEPDKEVDDPYFDGEGPKRSGCTLCGGCMVGCRHNAKNTLDKNYLYLAEKRGAEVIAETEVLDIKPLGDGEGGGYEISTRQSTGFLFKRRRVLRVGGVVMSGGVLGTLPLLMKCKIRGSLPKLSSTLGDRVRTNSEALLGARDFGPDVDHSKGIAITSGFHPDADTHVELVRYGRGQDSMGMLSTLITGGGKPWPRILRWLGNAVIHPLRFIRASIPFGMARQSIILLLMQPLDNHMRVFLRRSWWWPFSLSLSSKSSGQQSVPKYFPIGNEVAQRVSAKMKKGQAMSMLPEVFLGVSSTAHILGGCPMGETGEQGVIDSKGRVHGYDNFYIADGTVIQGNLSVNPSLTITAMTEWIMSHVGERSAKQ